MYITRSRIAGLSNAPLTSKWLYQTLYFHQQHLRLLVFWSPCQHLSSFLIFANLWDVKWYPCFLSVFQSSTLNAFSLSDPLQSSKDAPQRIETWFLYSRRERWILSPCEWQRDTEAGVMCSLLGNAAVGRHEAWPSSWNMSRRFQTELKDIPDGEAGARARQRHRAVKPHHSKNLLSVNDCVESQDWEAQEEADMGRPAGGPYCRHRESLGKVLSRILTDFVLFKV